MISVLVTGGAGFIGSHTVVELSLAGYRPVIVDDFSNSSRTVPAAIARIVGDEPAVYEGRFQDRALLDAICRQERIAGVIHFAAHKSVPDSISGPRRYYENNIGGLITLVGALEDLEIPSFIYSSSCSVYGEPDSLPLDEDSPIKPATSPYGSTKQMGEIVVRDTSVASRSLSSLSLRYFNPIGAHGSGLIGELPIGPPANLVPLITQAAAGRRAALTVHGTDYGTPDGTCIRDYIHVVDLAKAHVRAFERGLTRPPGEYDVVNLGTGSGSSVLDVIRAFEEATGRDVPYRLGPRRGGDVAAIYAGVGKSRRLLDWESELTLGEGLGDAWRWQQSLDRTGEPGGRPVALPAHTAPGP